MTDSSMRQTLTMRDQLEIVLEQVYPEMRDVTQRVYDLTENQHFTFLVHFNVRILQQRI